MALHVCDNCADPDSNESFSDASFMSDPLERYQAESEETYFDWYVKSCGVKLESDITVSSSNVGDPASGNGLFVENKTYEHDERDLLLRIPKKTTFAVSTIQRLLLDESHYESRSDMKELNEKIKKIMIHVSQVAGEAFMTETIALAIFFIGFHTYTWVCPKIFADYISKVLLDVEINVPITRHTLFLDAYGHHPEVRKNEEVFERIKSFFGNKSTHGDYDVNDKDMRHIYAAILSRILEIPVEISADSDDFYTDITLVPVLDYVNHSTINPTCYFDIDRATNEILLKRNDSPYDDEKIAKQELYIEYYDTVEYTKFTFTYGFIPKIRNDQTAYFNLSLERDSIPQYIRIFYKWFDINPVIQFYKNGEDGEWQVHSDIDEFIDILLPFIVDSSIEGTEVWTHNPHAFRSFPIFHGNRDIESVRQFMPMMDFRIYSGERDNSDAMKFPQIARTLKFRNEQNELKKRRPTKDQARAHYRNLTDSDKVNTIHKFRDFFNDYYGRRMWHLQRSVDNVTGPFAMPPYEKGECKSFLDLCNHEIQILERMKARGIENAIAYNDSLEQKPLNSVPIPPASHSARYDDETMKKIRHSYDVTHDRSSQLSDRRTEADFTDFLQEELDNFAQNMGLPNPES
ncbi:cytochrome c lysine N-methyltransferase [Maudiozyma exigua]|uniref:Cytochrome c lysine N-methyltransferase n=1 Tax=Maudiozyma exigua TaxID=34358 RepID=A0A9P6W1L3_MAUEX|nr:cytochrome c lysine N-methyltransferase [Kazachstania exigua]